MSDKVKINRENLVLQKEALEILKCDRSKLNQYVNQGELQRIKSRKDKRYSFYLKSAIEELANREEEFYYE